MEFDEIKVLKFHHMSVIREGEESQEDSLKMRNVEKFPEVSSVFKSDEKKPRYCDLKILVYNQTRS